MTRRKPRFELVHSDAGHFARFVGANGRKVWQTEVYTQRRNALNAIALVAGHAPQDHGYGLEVRVSHLVDDDGLLEVREVDERGGSDA